MSKGRERSWREREVGEREKLGRVRGVREVRGGNKGHVQKGSKRSWQMKE